MRQKPVWIFMIFFENFRKISENFFAAVPAQGASMAAVRAGLEGAGIREGAKFGHLGKCRQVGIEY